MELVVSESCGNCRFWFVPDEGGQTGYCRREPPKVFMVQKPASQGLSLARRSEPEMALMTNFPPTNADVWCGEYQEAK
jgi:hypothetical protein